MIDTQISSQLKSNLAKLRHHFLLEPYPEYSKRIKDLNTLKSLVLDNQQQILDAMSADFGHRSEDDGRIGDILSCVQGINYKIRNLKSWMKPNSRHVGILFQPASAKVFYQPLGVIGIIVPWNYPLFLSIGPLSAALAAGNMAMIKMSELSANLGALLSQLFAQYFGEEKIAIVNGEADVAAAFSQLEFDHLFFTGSTHIGKMVMSAAAKNLVPVTLELGGKSPAIIGPDIPIEKAVSRFILGKTINAGQTCVAPDYLLCPASKLTQLKEAIHSSYSTLYPNVCNNNDCTAIVSDRHFDRLEALVEDARSKGAKVAVLGNDSGNTKTRQMPLTLLFHVTDNMRVMQEEIFGPLLPVIGYEDISEAVEFVNAQARPLALYLYSFDAELQKSISETTISGGMAINDASFQVVIDDLPFGGVGPSGMGRYHGKEGFQTFSHGKSIFKKGRINLTPMLFPPFGKAIHKLVYKLFIR